MNKNPKNGDIIEFNQSKNFKYIKSLSGGGSGDTHLFLDEITQYEFVIKKFSPKDEEKADVIFNYFIDEIKILFNLSHPNIVRVYNYYIYNKSKLAYIQMEFIDGETLDNYNDSQGKSWEEIFIDSVNAFSYLESKNILHRDIRAQNIMIDKNNNVKIIDFGFSKNTDGKEYAPSLILNWPVTELPSELKKQEKYDHSTEVFFLGKLFKNLISEKEVTFKYQNIIEKMVEINELNRYKTFEEVSNSISQIDSLDFSDYEKNIYNEFADNVFNNIIKFYSKPNLINNSETIINSLSSIISKNILEYEIKKIGPLVSAFVFLANYSYKSSSIDLKIVQNFYKWLDSASIEKRKIIIDNIQNRINNIRIEEDKDLNLPF